MSTKQHAVLFYIIKMCVSGETLILTRDGYFPIVNLKDKEIEIWNGTGWVKTMVKQTSIRHFITVVFSNGCSITCSPDHGFTTEKIPTQFLAPGMEIPQVTLPILNIETQQTILKYPYLHGVLCSFGCFTENGPIIDIMGPVLPLILDHPDMIIAGSGDKVFPDDISQKYFAPINVSIETKLQWLSGFIDARSFMNELGVMLINVKEKLLREIQLLLTTLNIFSILEESRAVKIPIENDGLLTVNNFKLIIPWKEFDKLIKLGLIGLFSNIEIPEILDNIYDSYNKLTIKDIVDIGCLGFGYTLTNINNNPTIYNGITG